MDTIQQEKRLSIAATLYRINHIYGRGDIVEIDWSQNTAKIQKQYGTELVRFRVEGTMVYFRGVKRSAKYGNDFVAREFALSWVGG